MQTNFSDVDSVEEIESRSSGTKTKIHDTLDLSNCIDVIVKSELGKAYAERGGEGDGGGGGGRRTGGITLSLRGCLRKNQTQKPSVRSSNIFDFFY